MRASSVLKSRVAPLVMAALIVLSVSTEVLPAQAAPSTVWVSSELGTTLDAGGFASVDHVSCVSATFCAASGIYYDSSFNSQIYASTWNGVRWNQVEIAASLNTGGSGDTNAISCASPTLCVITGYYKDALTGFHPYAAVWNGSTWQSQEIAGSLNSNGDGDAYHASCAGTNFCAVVGEFNDLASVRHAYVSTWNGTKWSDHALTTGLSPTGTSYASSLTCVSATYCLAGGQYSDASSYSQGFVSVWNGTSWTDHEVAASLNAGGSAAVQTLQCLSTTFCSAGGSYSDAANNQYAFVGFWNGTTWTYHDVVDALDTGHRGQVASTWCQSATWCVAAGTYYASLATQAFVSVWNGTTWSAHALVTALNTGGYARVSDVSCLTAGHCFVGGEYYDAAHHYQAFLSSSNGTTWTDQEELASLNTGANASVTDLTCANATFCAKTEFYRDGSKNGHGLVALTITPQAPLSVVPSHARGVLGHRWVLKAKGGSGTGILNFVVKGPGCSLRGSVLRAVRATTCVVTVQKAPSGIFLAAVSPPARFVVLKHQQARLSLANRVRHFRLGQKVPLRTTGGSGHGALHYSVTGRGCSLSGAVLSARVATTCVVVVHKAATATYAAQVSARTTFVFTHA